MSTEENKLLGRRCFEEGFKNGNLAVGDEPGAEVEEVLERKVFGLALALATEPSKLGQLRQLLVQLQEQEGGRRMRKRATNPKDLGDFRARLGWRRSTAAHRVGPCMLEGALPFCEQWRLCQLPGPREGSAGAGSVWRQLRTVGRAQEHL